MKNSSRIRHLLLDTKWFGLVMFTVLCICIFAPQSALAEWSSDPDVNTTVTTADGTQCRTQIIYDGSGGYFAIWRDQEAPGIFAQRYSASGNAQWGATGVEVCSVAYSNLEGVADGNGGVILAWSEDVGDDYYAVAQHLDADGNALWAAGGIAVTYGGEPWIASDGDGGAIIMTYSYGNVNRVTADGSLPWGDADNPVIYTEYDSPSATKIVPDGAGGAILVWTEYDGDNTNIAVQRVDSDGVLYGADPLLLTDTGSNECPRLIPTGDGGAIVIWDVSGEGYTIYAQKIGGDGVIQWTEGGESIASMTSLDTGSYGLASDGSGGAFITWPDQDDYTLYAQYIDASGDLVWEDPVQISLAGEYSEATWHPRGTVEDGSGGFITAWYNDDDQVKAQRCDEDGTVLWTDGGAVLSNGTKTAYAPKLASNGEGGAVAIWIDTRGDTGQDIYIQGIDAGGDLGNPGYTGRFPWNGDGDGICFITSAW